MNEDQLMITTFTQAFNKYVYDKCVIGKLAKVDFKDNLRKGQKINVIMPASVTLSDYTGGNLSAAEAAANAVAEIVIDKGKSFHFYIDEVKRQEIADAPNLEQKVDLAKEYCNDAIEQFAAAVDTAYADLYTMAGHYLTGGSDAAITLSTTNCKEILAYMQAEFQRGDGKGHTNWVDGQMLAIVPPEYQFFLGQLDDFTKVESGHRKIEKGFIGKLAGWDIMVSNNIKKDNNTHYCLFGQRGKTLAGGIQKKLTMKSYEPELNFNKAYKGYGLYGVGAPRADLLGAVKVSASMSIGS